MREERGRIVGDVTVNEQYTLWGMIAGNVRVIKGGKLYLRGSVYGSVTVEKDGRAHVFGNVQGSLTVDEEAKVVHSGTIGGDIINRGGRVFIEQSAKTMGKIKTTKEGKTSFETSPANDD